MKLQSVKLISPGTITGGKLITGVSASEVDSLECDGIMVIIRVDGRVVYIPTSNVASMIGAGEPSKLVDDEANRVLDAMMVREEPQLFTREPIKRKRGK